MQAYDKKFAHIYNKRWAGFARRIAPSLIEFYSSTPIGQKNTDILDLCCGAGHLAMHLLEEGYRVVGLDLSEHMLRYARENTAEFIASGQAEFIRADAADFKLNEKFGLVVSAYDSLNHLENEQALVGCFRSVFDVCDGYFIFDLNTRWGLKRWNGIHIDDSSDDALIITRGIFDEQSVRAWTKFTGFAVNPDGSYDRFDETVYNTAFDMEWVRSALLDIGWNNIRFARYQDLATPVANPEKEPRAVIIAEK